MINKEDNDKFIRDGFKSLDNFIKKVRNNDLKFDFEDDLLKLAEKIIEDRENSTPLSQEELNKIGVAFICDESFGGS